MMADREVDDALAHSFLAELPDEVISDIRASGERADYPAGTVIYQPGAKPWAALVVQGLLRVYLVSLEGRQVTVRYARPGDVLGVAVLVGGPANVGAQTVEPSGLFRISSQTLTAAARRDSRVSWAIAGELNRRLYDTLEQTAVNAFGSVRQRVAAHLLDLASAQQAPAGRLAAHEPPRRIVITGQLGPFRATTSYLLEPAAGGTRLANDIELEPVSALLRPVAPLATASIKAAVARNLSTLKELLEGAG
jgi:CRP/FNR family transcriptional regulator, cyclic AMP receptor protein